LHWIDGRHDGRRILFEAAVLTSRDPLDLSYGRYTVLLDTGATSSWITPRVISEMNLVELGRETVSVATEERVASTYLFRVAFFPVVALSNQLPYVFPDITGFRLAQRIGFDLLLGMDILKQTDFSLSRDGSWRLRFG